MNQPPGQPIPADELAPAGCRQRLSLAGEVLVTYHHGTSAIVVPRTRHHFLNRPDTHGL